MDQAIDDVLLLDEELLDHFADPESCKYLWKERFSADLLTDEEEFAKTVWGFVSEFIETYHTYPEGSVLGDEFPQFEFKAPAHPVEYLLKRLRDRYAKTEIKIALKRVARALDDPADARSLALTEFSRISQKTTSRSHQLSTEDWQEHLENYKAKVLEGRYQGASFGWPEVTDALGGLRKGGLFYVVGRPKRFKSWFLLSSAVAAQQEGKRVLFLSLELPEEEMYARSLCLISNVSWFRYSHACLEPKDYDKLKKGMELRASYPSMVIARPEVGNRSVPSLFSLAKEQDAEVLYVDQMSFVESHRGPTNAPLWERIKYQCEDLKNSAVGHDVPIYIANQFNRLADNPKLQEMGTLDMIAGGDSIGQYADMVLGLYQNKAMKQGNMIEFGTVDSRSFEHALWRFAVSLNDECQFRLTERVVD